MRITSAWQELRRVGEELRVRLHLVAMDARDVREHRRELRDRIKDAVTREIDAWRSLARESRRVRSTPAAEQQRNTE